jgi:VCBS repeat-containing protein
LWGLLRFNQTEPVAADAELSVVKYQAVDIDLLGGAFDLDGLAGATVTVTGGPAFGTLADPEGDGTYLYTSTVWPACGDPFACTDVFSYTVTDGTGLVSNTGTVTITVTNTAPVAGNDTIIIKAPTIDGSVDVLLNDVDAEGDLAQARNPLVTLIGQPVERNGVQVGTIADAVLGANGRTLTYTPPSGFAGVVLITYQVTDESGAVSNQAVIRAAVNVDDITVTQARYQPQNGQWTVAGTCTDPFLADGVTPTTITVFLGPTIEGSPPVIGTGTCVAGDPVGTWAFSGTSTAPAPDPNNENYVSAESALQGFDEAFPVEFAGQNNSPVAVADAFEISEDHVLTGNVLANDLDADFDPLAAMLVANVANGTLQLNADGFFTYTPDPNYHGTDTFTYRADDGKDVSDVVTVTIVVTSVNDAPSAINDGYAMSAASVLNVAPTGVLANDSDVEGDAYVLNTTPISGPSAGNSLTLNADGSFVYTPDLLFTGADTFVYEICETETPEGLCSQATVTISVGINDAPAAVDDAYDAVQNTPLSVTAPGVLDNDTDADGNPLTAALINGPANGSLALNPDGSFTYTPNFNFVGIDSFTYLANDGTVDSAPATATITVKDVVTVTSASYRERQNRWNIQGTVSVPSSSVSVYLNAVLNANLIGTASVDDISGAWSFPGNSALVVPAGSSVIAVSTGGGVSAPFAVVIRPIR